MSLDDGTLRLGPSGSEAKAICVFVHGRGQSPGEMQSRVVARLSAPSVTFVLPRAPRGAWWDARAVDPLTPVARAQLSDALDHLAAVVAAARAAGAPTTNASGRLLAGRLPRHRVSLRRFAPAGRRGGADGFAGSAFLRMDDPPPRRPGRRFTSPAATPIRGFRCRPSRTRRNRWARVA